MTGLQFIFVFAVAQGAWLATYAVMRGKVTPIRVALLVLCLVVFISAFVLGAHWNHTDFACHPGQHCFPWGN